MFYVGHISNECQLYTFVDNCSHVTLQSLGLSPANLNATSCRCFFLAFHDEFGWKWCTTIDAALVLFCEAK